MTALFYLLWKETDARADDRHAAHEEEISRVKYINIVAELKSRSSNEKRAHYELCAFIPQVITSMSEEATVELAHFGTNVGQLKQESTFPCLHSLI